VIVPTPTLRSIAIWTWCQVFGWSCAKVAVSKAVPSLRTHHQ
jgi:hypothetical protein